MANRTMWITAKCGHEVEYTAEYKPTDWRVKRDVENIERGLCDACQTSLYAENLGVVLPELAGTERQVSWATELRFRFLNRTAHLVTDEVSRGIVAALAVRTEAKVWIESRGEDAVALVSEAIAIARAEAIVAADEAGQPVPALTFEETDALYETIGAAIHRLPDENWEEIHRLGILGSRARAAVNYHRPLPPPVPNEGEIGWIW